MLSLSGRQRWWPAAALTLAVLTGCTTSPTGPAPVHDIGAVGYSPAPRVDPATLPGAENAGKPGYYTVAPGDTVMSIARHHNQNWRDIVRWNDMGDANVIEVGQVLRVVPPVPSRSPATTTTTTTTNATTTNAATATPANGSATATATPTVATQTTPGTAASADSMAFIWPANGNVLSGFDEAKNSKGLSISGRAGDPVVAAADGRVMYAGSGLRDFGNLVIIRHNNTYLTAYAHNQRLLVKEDQDVKKGQRIAEMGASGTDRVKLYFEVRRGGKPVDPARHLPPR